MSGHFWSTLLSKTSVIFGPAQWIAFNCYSVLEKVQIWVRKISFEKLRFWVTCWLREITTSKKWWKCSKIGDEKTCFVVHTRMFCLYQQNKVILSQNVWVISYESWPRYGHQLMAYLRNLWRLRSRSLAKIRSQNASFEDVLGPSSQGSVAGAWRKWTSEIPGPSVNKSNLSSAQAAILTMPVWTPYPKSFKLNSVFVLRTVPYWILFCSKFISKS